MKLSVETDEGKYRPGKITFAVKEGESINLGNIQEAIAATRLSGHTNMRVEYLEVKVRGKLVLGGQRPVLRVSGTGQEFIVEADDRDLEKRLLDVAESNEATVTVVGRVDGWNGRFPVVLRTLQRRYGTDVEKPILLVITSLEVSSKDPIAPR